ncbi:hypothetical protein CPB84DRAFT_1538045 [Gymnopilus junonius]|uniref:Uncharacterized protein n=1 Tax=Gymnopilus junonius TaxID=109634 RepID=A0A9P5NGG5_GYMJU|nr:hypothetical protein CPB84DRAFT_1538045 [Gymnopilus junonius]
MGANGTLEPPPKAPTVVASGDDQMDVDAAVVNGTESCPTLQTPTAKWPSGLQPPINATSVENGQPEQPVGLLMADGTRAKSMHTILLLRDLLQFLRIPGWDAPPRQGGDAPGVQKGDGTSASLVDPRAYYALLEGEETMNVEQRVDILAHASIALAKALFPFRGSESQLGTRINALDSRLHEQFEMLLKPEEREKAMQVVKEALKGWRRRRRAMSLWLMRSCQRIKRCRRWRREERSAIC